MFGGAPQKFPNNAAGVFGIVQRSVVHPPAIGPQTIRELAHGGKDEGDLFGVMGNVGCLAHDLGHDNNIAGFIGFAQGREGRRKLVTQNKDELYHGTVAPLKS